MKKQLLTLIVALFATTVIAQTQYKKAIMWGTVGIKGTVLEKCQAIKDAGFDGVEFSSHMDREECIAALKATGLEASSVCNSKHWSVTMSSPDVAIREQAIKEMIVAMEDAVAYGTDAVLLVPGTVNDKDTSYDECWERSTECIKKLVPIAKKMGVTIAIENVWNNFLLSPMEAARFVDQFKSKYVKMYFDCGNILNYGWPEQWIKILDGKRIARVHLKDFSNELAGKSGKWAGFGVPFYEGSVNWKAVMTALDDAEYSSPWLTIEHGGGSTPEGLKELARRIDLMIANKPL